MKSDCYAPTPKMKMTQDKKNMSKKEGLLAKLGKTKKGMK